MLGQDLIEKWPQKKVDYLRHTFLLFKRAYLRAGGDHLDITPADAMLVYLNVYNQDRLLDTPTDIVVNRLCKIWRELVIAGKMMRQGRSCRSTECRRGGDARQVHLRRAQLLYGKDRLFGGQPPAHRLYP